MKKKIKALLCLIFSCICFMTIGCRPLFEIYHPPEVEWDGRFLYYLSGYDGNPYYYILGSEPELGVKSEVLDKLYIPSHYKGVRVDGFRCGFDGYDEKLGEVVHYTFGLDITPVKEIYCPYYMNSDIFLGERNFRKMVMTMIERVDDAIYPGSTVETMSYIPNITFEYVVQYAKNQRRIQIIWLKDYALYCYDEHVGLYRYIYKSNTAYMFNYEGSPNEDYYFINDFERGGLIENTPYEPIREGYEFCGWYKESECITKWDFTTDVLPAPTYDENGELEYVETKLYAKWNKI